MNLPKRHWWPDLPVLRWAREYDRDTLLRDGVAALIVTLMLIPQSLAYAQLAGLPPEVGLYASVAPLLVYALLGTSRVLAVGPVAVVSLMTAAAVGEHAAAGGAHHLAVAITLAFLSGLILLAMGLLRLGFLAHFLSHPVIAGFITASGILIAASQLKTLLGVSAGGHNLLEMLAALWAQRGQVHGLTLGIGAASLAFLFWVRRGLQPLLRRLGVPPRAAELGAKAGPVAAIVGATLFTWAVDGGARGVRLVGAVPQGLPPLTQPVWDLALWQALLVPALLISVVGFVESVSVGQTLAAKRRQRIEPDQELVALGGSNLSAAFTGGFPVTGGFARSVVNFDAGAQTPAAGVYTAAGILLASLLLTPALSHLPQATLAATIVVAVLSLVDIGILRRTWAYSRADFAAVLATLLVTLAVGVESGLVAGVGVSLALHLWRSSQPHIAEVGQVPGTEHYRNVLRHQVITQPQVLALRMDESLYFANARALEDRINAAVALRPELRHVVLQCSAINYIDASALDSLEAIDQRLRDAAVQLHLSEVKGPVMDKLQRSDFLQHLSGRVFLTHHQAATSLAASLNTEAGQEHGQAALPA
ncbi:MAG: sulfate permease [Hydrogenophaga sp.]|uniref:SulP family inorganic anion transporter n=1 Tax=Hydrogenophaga sp. TaxID=1904254 RepID=UPI0016947CE0|nr:sulfate permease [Hydrogenophaga sp.]NIM43680.1 sulfate permease [Hydrogenophaga sp.]NIN28749.1 sulfate permease [Hydrogenophaga sp.]NIN33208.1 sulfate permease [Hydrogenophaga sp.]NIN57883.1 sulfate permease [Hydrogenophaga sp.]NIO54178.1 sulfate permease [Hydrogenophaga sp.]